MQKGAHLHSDPVALVRSTSALQTDSESSAEQREAAQGHRESLTGALVAACVDDTFATSLGIQPLLLARAAKLNELQSSGGLSVRTGEVATHAEYAQLLRDTRIVISPLGYAMRLSTVDGLATRRLS